MASISLDYIKDIKEEQISNYIDNYEKYENAALRNKKRELRLLSKTAGACSKERIAGILPVLNDVDEMVLKNMIDSSFYNMSTMTATSCVVDATFYVPVNTISTMVRLKRWIRNLKKLAESVQGVALKGDLGTAEDIFILKAPRNDHHNDDIIHEAVVGIYGTNRLRSSIPNFAYCYGTFSCASPIVASDGHVASWCVGNDDNKVFYIITENIYPSIAYDEYIESASVEEFLSIYLQILYSLHQAHKEIDFTHYDLHSKNVLIREYKEGSYYQVAYNTENGVEYLVSDRIATIIDYGFSHFTYKGVHYGIDLPGYSVYSDRSHILHDAYKILLSGAYHLKDTNSPLLGVMSTIYSFFSQDNMLDILEEHFELDKFSLPLIEGDILDLTTFIRSNFECKFIGSSPGGFDLLQCSIDSKCPTVQSIFSDIGLMITGEKRARDFIEYYEAVNYNKEKVSINYGSAKRDFEESIVSDYEDIANNITKMNDMSRDSIDEYMSFLYLLVETLDMYNTLLLEIYIGKEVMYMNGEDSDFSEFLDAIKHLGLLVELVEDTENAMKDQYYDEQYKHVEVSKRILEIYKNIKEQDII